MATIINEAHFSVNSTGEEFGDNYQGNFTAKIRLGGAGDLEQDIIRRRILGPDGASATELAQTLAHALSFLAVRLTVAPSWWKDANNGQDLERNVIFDVFTECFKEIQKVKASFVKKTTEEVKADLKEFKAE